ncbi:hypothetical protein FXN61_03300 [Lentzea sp. PSKA42]|uniref:Uncharacterized protein n=1 Tax=Lentzea indica TaxID=2604800 RepID=A0ABX1FB55_9PSEU|nr:hypothetical protein [Lentzea indica]NKE55903.1 hypothetical protein [Lentzea indica]
MRVDPLIDTVFIAVYAPLLWHAWQWLRTKEPTGPPSPLRSLMLAGSPYPRAVPITVLAVGHLAGNPMTFVALGFLTLVALESAWRNRERWVRVHVWALGRLRVPAAIVLLVSAMLLFGDTTSLRRPGVGLAMWMAVVALGASVWFVTRRLVLTSWPQKTWRSARPELGALIRLSLCVLVGVIGWIYGPRQLTGYAVVLGTVVLLGLVWVVWELEDGEAAQSKLGEADRVRARSAMRPGPQQRPAVMRVARGLAVTPLVALAVAYIPMAYDGQSVLTALRVLVLCCIAVLFGDWLMARSSKGPWHAPHHWWFTAVIVAVSTASLITVGAIGRTLPLAVVFLMFAGLLLSEAQRFAETVPVPKGLLFLGFTRTPVALLIILCVLASGLSYPTDAVESWSTNLRQVVRIASTVMAFEPAST